MPNTREVQLRIRIEDLRNGFFDSFFKEEFWEFLNKTENETDNLWLVTALQEYFMDHCHRKENRDLRSLNNHWQN